MSKTANQTLKIDRFSVHYHNKEELLVLKREIFANHSYYFETDNPRPVIIDAGAHIGLATLYFKKQFPGAVITAIEPNPTNFKLLEQNIWENDLRDVTTVEMALAPTTGQITMHQDATQSWLSTSSIHERAWNGEQETSAFEAKTITLSSLLTEPVDLLKLDIEGAELAVLAEAAEQLHLISKIFVEFHPTENQRLEDLEGLLVETGFVIKFSKHGATVSKDKATGMVLVEATNLSHTINERSSMPH
ncbi:MAG: hypothetical protein COY81_04620 [Candidatus Pacebacteria bacterium CG_4_10_14_0_8_um_filter_43_12]|nr:MAG: hypothetical protein COY81_04620 [Candidatus Pacebacteria bacterium CG_4_10_14_0_8_um_filter_43_12]